MQISSSLLLSLRVRDIFQCVVACSAQHFVTGVCCIGTSPGTTDNCLHCKHGKIDTNWQWHDPGAVPGLLIRILYPSMRCNENWVWVSGVWEWAWPDPKRSWHDLQTWPNSIFKWINDLLSYSDSKDNYMALASVIELECKTWVNLFENELDLTQKEADVT